MPHFIAVGHILQSTDQIATLPERFAGRCEAPFGLVTSPHPARLPACPPARLPACPPARLPACLPEIAINLFWHAKFNRDPANMWLRQLFVELFADSDGKRTPPRARRGTASAK